MRKSASSILCLILVFPHQLFFKCNFLSTIFLVQFRYSVFKGFRTLELLSSTTWEIGLMCKNYEFYGRLLTKKKGGEIRSATYFTWASHLHSLELALTNLLIPLLIIHKMLLHCPDNELVLQPDLYFSYPWTGRCTDRLGHRLALNVYIYIYTGDGHVGPRTAGMPELVPQFDGCAPPERVWIRNIPYMPEFMIDRQLCDGPVRSEDASDRHRLQVTHTVKIWSGKECSILVEKKAWSFGACTYKHNKRRKATDLVDPFSVDELCFSVG